MNKPTCKICVFGKSHDTDVLCNRSHERVLDSAHTRVRDKNDFCGNGAFRVLDLGFRQLPNPQVPPIVDYVNALHLVEMAEQQSGLTVVEKQILTPHSVIPTNGGN